MHKIESNANLLESKGNYSQRYLLYYQTRVPFLAFFSLRLITNKRWELGENQFWHTLILFTQPIFYMGPTGTLLFFYLKQTLKSLSSSEGGIDAKRSFLQPSKRCYLFFSNLGNLSFFFLFYNFYWSTVDLESCITYRIRCLRSDFSLLLTLTNSMSTRLGVCVPFFFLLLFHHNQDSIIR